MIHARHFALTGLALWLSACTSGPETRKDPTLTGPATGPVASTSTTDKSEQKPQVDAPAAPRSTAGQEKDFT
ncbi:addiction module protein, partial [Corallococcus praedator]